MNNIKIKNNLGDSACLYKCMADYIYDNQELKMEDLILEYIVPEHRNMYLSYLKQIYIAERLQMIIVNWIVNNYNFSFNGLTIKEIVNTTHNIKCKTQYNKIYKIFAGDPDYTYEDTGIIYKSGKRKGYPRLMRVDRPGRWGGLPEIIAFSQIFKCPVQVFILQRKRIKDGKIIISNKITKNSFFTIKDEINITFDGPIAKFLLIENKNTRYKYLFTE